MNRIEFGDCRETMRKWAEQGIKAQTCVTSPPYFGLRDYGTSTWVGGNADCDHVEKIAAHGGERADRDQSSQVFTYKNECQLCGAISEDKQIGREETTEEYITAMVEVFRCVRDVLADDGTCWINIGDSYSRTGGTSLKPRHWDGRERDVGNTVGFSNLAKNVGLKEKDLIGIPWMLAFALRADGWYLRQDIIWHKPNPMPESVRDRCTKAHEYIFLLSKSQKYFYDHEAILEDAKWERWGDQTVVKEQQGTAKWIGNKSKADLQAMGKKNRRSVWSVATKPYKGAHFATYPEELITPCILAGSRVGDIVLDPFMGSGTTAAVAVKNGRQYLGCELNEDYKSLQDERIANANETIIGKTHPDVVGLFDWDNNE